MLGWIPGCRLLIGEMTVLAIDSNPPIIGFDSYFKYFETHLFNHAYVTQLFELSSLIRSTPLADQNIFDELFMVGPGGIGNLLDLLGFIYNAISRIPTSALTRLNPTCLATHEKLIALSSSILTSTKFFRAQHNRSLWDPKGGFREFQIVCQTSCARLPVSILYPIIFFQIMSLLSDRNGYQPYISKSIENPNGARHCFRAQIPTHGLYGKCERPQRDASLRSRRRTVWSPIFL